MTIMNCLKSQGCRDIGGKVDDEGDLLQWGAMGRMLLSEEGAIFILLMP
ncbi:hypothetical protein [Bartonella sp. MU70NMGDW]